MSWILAIFEYILGILVMVIAVVVAIISLPWSAIIVLAAWILIRLDRIEKILAALRGDVK